MDDGETTKAAFDALKEQAEAVKQSMDKIDAAEHLDKMGASTWMDHSDTNILTLMKQTERLSLFLSEIESEVKRHSTDSEGEKSSPAVLQKHEKDITTAVNRLLKLVELGDPITAAATDEQNPAAKDAGNHEKALVGKLMQAADKEDKAAIIQKAGDMAEGQINSVMQQAQVEMQQVQQNEQRIAAEEAAVEEQAQEQAAAKEEAAEDAEDEEDDIHVIHDAQPMVMVEDDLDGTLKSSVTGALNQNLDQILSLFRQRKIQGRSLSTEEYQGVNHQIRQMSAMLMDKYATKDESDVTEMPARCVDSVAKWTDDSGYDCDSYAALSDGKHCAKYGDEDYGTGGPANKVCCACGGGTMAGAAQPMVEVDTMEEPEQVADVPDKQEAPAAETEDKPAQDKPVEKPVETKPIKSNKAQNKAQTKAQKSTAAAKAVVPKAKDPVSDFVWSTLGKHGMQQVQTGSCLKDLLSHGVRLPMGGTLKFVTPKRAK